MKRFIQAIVQRDTSGKHGIHFLFIQIKSKKKMLQSNTGYKIHSEVYYCVNLHRTVEQITPVL